MIAPRLRAPFLARWHRAHSRQPVLRIVLAAAVLVPLATAALAAWRSWENVWREARGEVTRSAEAAAEYARRVFDMQRLLAERADDLIRGLPDHEIRAREEEMHRGFRELAAGLPGTRIVLATDAEATVLVASNAYPVAPASGADREWTIALRDPATPEPHISAVHVSRLDSRMFVALTIRRGGARAREAPPGGFRGIVQVTTGPEEIAEGFTSLIERPEAVMALVRRDGSVLARLPPFSSPLPAIGAGSEFHRTVEDGFARRVYVTTSVATGEPTLYAQRRAGEYPVHAIVGRRVSTIHAAWAWRFLGLLAWAAPAMLCLVWAALHARRRAIETEQAEAARRAESARRAIAEAREAAEARFRTVFESDAMGMAIFEPATAATFAINDRLLAMQGLTRAAFTAGAGGWGHATAPDCREADARARAQAIARGTWDPFEKDYLRPDGSRLPVRLFAAPLPREPGLVVVLVEDISRQRAAEARRELLLREIAHRARNTFALLRSLVRLSRAPTAAALAEALDGRIQALARSTALLTRDAGDGAAIEALLRTSLAPFLRGVDEDGREDPRVTLTGPVLMLDPSVAQPLAMVLHELATNAAKYGALSWPKGSLAIAWERRPDAKDTLVLRWSETGAPAPLTPPTGDGFGSELLDAIVTGQLGGQVSREWRAEGLVSTLTVPLRPEG